MKERKIKKKHYTMIFLLQIRWAGIVANQLPNMESKSGDNYFTPFSFDLSM